MAINPSRYDTPRAFTPEIDWSPLSKIGDIIKQQRDEDEAARLITNLYNRGDSTSAPYSAPYSAPAQVRPSIQRADLPPVPGYNTDGRPSGTSAAAPAPAVAAGPTDAPLWLQSAAEGNYSPGAPRPRVDPRSPIGRLMARLGMGPSPDSVQAPFPVAGAAPVPGLVPDNAVPVGPEPPWHNPAMAQGQGWPFAPGAAPPPTGGAVPPWPGEPAAPAAVAEAVPLPRPRPMTPDVALPPTAAAPSTYRETGEPQTYSQAALDRAQAVIRQKESGGNYRNVTTTRDRSGRLQSALGAYGVMDFNVGPWTKQVLGREMSPQEFLADDKAQDAVARAKLGEYASKYGMTGAARAWFAGESGMRNPNARDPLGTSVTAYASDFENKMGLPPEITTGSSSGAQPTRAAEAQVQVAQRAYQNLASPQPASAAEISSEELSALYRNPLTRPIATAFLQKKLDPGGYKFMAAGDNIIRYNERTGQYDMIHNASEKPVVVDGALVNPVSGKVIYGGNDKTKGAPSGFQWSDPNDHSKGLEAIPGGPATQLPAEVAAKIGLGEGFLTRLPSIKQQIEADKLGIDVNPTAHLASLAGVGPAAEVKRQIESGADSLLRMLTGAGMGVSEADKYVKRYEVNARDTKDQLLSKIQQLEEDMHFTANRIGQGHGGSPLAKYKRTFGGSGDGAAERLGAALDATTAGPSPGTALQLEVGKAYYGRRYLGGPPGDPKSWGVRVQ